MNNFLNQREKKEFRCQINKRTKIHTYLLQVLGLSRDMDLVLVYLPFPLRFIFPNLEFLFAFLWVIDYLSRMLQMFRMISGQKDETRADYS